MCPVRQPDGSGEEDPFILTDQMLDNMWYEAFANKVHSFGKSWPDPLTDEEAKECEQYADSIVRRPKHET